MKSKKRVLHIIQSLDSGGCENMLLRTIPLLTDEFEHQIITLHRLGELAPRFAEKRIPVTTVHWRGFLDIAGYKRLLTAVHQFAPSVTITYLFHADMVGRLFLQRKMSAPVIPFLRTTYNHPKYLIARLMEKATKSLVPRYLANSEAVKDFYVSKIGVPKEKITVISNGIDTDYFDSIVPDPNLRQSLRILPDDFVIICVANFHPNKGHRYLLDAFEATYQKHTNVRLLLIGDGAERNNLERQIVNYQSKENILFLGRRTDVPQLLKISDCFVLPTLFEGMSNAIMEAMASGLPVITTDIPENRFLIKNNINGILVKANDAEELSRSISLLKNDTLRGKELGLNGQKSIRQSLSIKMITHDWKNFLATI